MTARDKTGICMTARDVVRPVESSVAFVDVDVDLDVNGDVNMDATVDGRHETFVIIAPPAASKTRDRFRPAAECGVNGGDPVHVHVAVKVHVYVTVGVDVRPSRHSTLAEIA